MGFFKKIGKAFKKVGKAVGKVAKKVVKVGGTVLNGVGKIASATGIPIISQAGKLVDSLIPDKKVEEMTEAVQDDGVVRVDKVEETVQQYVEPQYVQATTRSLTTQLAKTTGATIDDSKAATSISTWDKVKQYLKKPITWVCIGVVGLLSYFAFFKGNKRKSW